MGKGLVWLRIRFKVGIDAIEPVVFGTEVEFDLFQSGADKIIAINLLADEMRMTLFSHFQLGDFKPVIERVG